MHGVPAVVIVIMGTIDIYQVGARDAKYSKICRRVSRGKVLSTPKAQ